MVIRTAEVSGADAIAIDGAFDHEAKRAALRAVDARGQVHAGVLARRAGGARRRARGAARHRRVALDESGERAHLATSTSAARACSSSAARTAASRREVLARCDARIRVPMAGFIPCYNLQAAVSAVAVERLRQLASSR